MSLVSEKVGGLYLLWLSPTRYYGGRAQNFKRRWRSHKRDLLRGKHYNSRMQAVFNIYGQFEPEVLCYLGPKEQVGVEQEWLDEHFRKEGCVNLSPHARGGCNGHTAATRAKMSATRSSRPALVEGARRSIALNRLHNDPQKMIDRALALAEKNKGKKQTPEHIKKRAAAHRGRKNTEETRALMSESAKSRCFAHPTEHGPKTRALISQQQKGRIWINNGIQNQRLFPEEAQTFLDGVWERGRSKKPQHSTPPLRR